MSRYIDTQSYTEWLPPRNWAGHLPAGVVALPADHGFFKPLPAGHVVDWSSGLPDIVPVPPPTAEQLAAEADDAFKLARDAQVRALTVSVNGRTFDANETAQRRMKGAVDAARLLGSETVPLWKLADNTVVRDVPIDDLEMAHALAFIKMSELWVPQDNNQEN